MYGALSTFGRMGALQGTEHNAWAEGYGVRLTYKCAVPQVEGAQFAEAIAEALEPRMRLTGKLKTLGKFKEFFEGRTLEKGTQARRHCCRISHCNDLQKPR